MDSLTFDPVFRPALIVCPALLLAALALAHAWSLRASAGRVRAGVILILRLVVIAGLATILMRPLILEADRRPLTRPALPIVIDRSASMATRDVNGKSRSEAIIQTLAEQSGELRRLQSDYDLKVYEFSDQVRPTSFEQMIAAGAPDGEGTDIAAALLGASEAGESAAAGMLLISDGRVNHAAGSGGVLQATRHLRGRKIPVWTITVGQASKTRDVLLSARLSQNFLYARQPGAIDVMLEQTGYKGWPAVVRLKREGVEVSTQRVLLDDGASQLSFPITEPNPGLYQYEVILDPLPGEADLENNRRAVYARVTDRRTQVLVVEAEPYWDSKFMLRALRKDPNLEITSFFQVNDRKAIAIRQVSKPSPDRDPNQPPGGETVRIPRTKEELYAYDVVILGRGIGRLYSAEEMKMFKDYLTERGGNLIFSRGRATSGEQSALSELEPVIWGPDKLSDLRLALTERGRETFTFSGAADPSLMMHELPTMLSVARVEKEKSMAVILARTDTGAPGGEVAVLSWQRFGKGKVLSLGSSGLWRWSLTPDSAARYQGIYEEFWSQLVRWLVAYSDFLPNQEVTFEVNRNAFRLGELVRLTVRTRQIDLKNYRPEIELARRAGVRHNLKLDADPSQPGVFTSVFVPDGDGEYTATLRNNIGQPKEDVVRFTVYQDSAERRLVASDQGLMTQIARTTGGEALPLEQLKDFPEKLRRFQQLTAERRKPVDAWDHPSVFYILMGLTSLEWLIRRKSGLV